MRSGFIVLNVPKAGLFIKRGRALAGDGRRCSGGVVEVFATRELAVAAKKSRQKTLPEMVGMVIPVAFKSVKL